jgi:hypothetical protein
MNIDTALVMEQFLGHMSNFIIVVSFLGILTLCATSAYIYLVHHDKDEEWD